MPYFAKACISLLLYGASATLNKFYLLMNGIDFAVEVGQEPRQVKKGNVVVIFLHALRMCVRKSLLNFQK